MNLKNKEKLLKHNNNDNSILKKIKNLYNRMEKRYIVILIIAILIFLPYISNEFIEGHDYICHVSNIYALDEYISFSEGIFFPSKIRSVISNNLGYGNGIFYPQFAYYVTLYIYKIIKVLFGMSIVTSMKIYEFLVLFLAGIFMYKFVVQSFKNKDAALLAALIYMTAPYFIADIFTRTAYAEIGIFLFMPIVMIGINHILNKNYKSFIIYFVIGYSGMICSHLVMTVYFTILLIILLLINIKQVFNRKSIISFIIATLIVIRYNFTIFISDDRTYGKWRLCGISR